MCIEPCYPSRDSIYMPPIRVMCPPLPHLFSSIRPTYIRALKQQVFFTFNGIIRPMNDVCLAICLSVGTLGHNLYGRDLSYLSREFTRSIRLELTRKNFKNQLAKLWSTRQKALVNSPLAKNYRSTRNIFL